MTFSAGGRDHRGDGARPATRTANLSNAQGATIEDAEGVGTIRNGTSDDAVDGDATVDDGPRVHRHRERRELGHDDVDYTTAADSATAGDDYTSTSGTLTFSAGQRTATIEVTVLDDSDEEQDETFKVRLIDAAGRHHRGRRGRRHHPR